MFKNTKSLGKRELRLLVGIASIALALNLALVFIWVTGEPKDNAEENAVLLLTFDNISLSSETAIDSSRNGLDGKILSASIIERGGGGAVAFDSENEMVIVDDADHLSINESQGFTVMMWVRFDDTSFTGDGTGKNYINFVNKGGEGNYEWMWRQYNSSNSEERGDRISFYVFNKDGGLGAGSYVQDEIKEGEWMHLAGVIRKGKIELWKNGAKKDSDKLSEYSITPENGNAPLAMGSLKGFTFNGALDDFRVYSEALSEKEIRRIYLEGNSR